MSAATNRGLRVRPADERAMGLALLVAQRAVVTGDVPVGAVLLDAEGTVVAQGWNQREATGDPTAHAEQVALRRAGQAQRRWRLEGHTLVVTLEPCLMCAGAVLAARVPRLVFGAWDTKAGAVGSVWDVIRDRAAAADIEVVAGVRADACAELLQDFFTARRWERELPG